MILSPGFRAGGGYEELGTRKEVTTMDSMTQTRNMAQEYADSLNETLTELVAAIEAGGEYEDQDAREYLDEMPLELVAQVGEPFSVLLTFGGPNAWIEWTARGGTDSAVLLTAWGGDRGRVSSPAVRWVASYFAELMEVGD